MPFVDAHRSTGDGVHEGGSFEADTQAVFVGCPEVKDGYMLASEKPGLGIEVDEKAAAKFPFPGGPPNFDYSWGTTRRRDGTVIRPSNFRSCVSCLRVTGIFGKSSSVFTSSGATPASSMRA